MPTVDIAPNFERSGVIAGFVLGLGTGLAPSITKGVLFSQGNMHRPATAPVLADAPDSQLTYLFCNATNGFYWADTLTPETEGDAYIGWVVANLTAIVAVSKQVAQVGEASSSGGGGGSHMGGSTPEPADPIQGIGEITERTATALNAAIAALPAEGGALRMAAGEWTIDVPVAVDADKHDIQISGAGAATIWKRTENMPAGSGMLNLFGKRMMFRDFTIDGNVLASALKARGTMIGENSQDDPMHADLVLNSSVWVHPGAEDITFEGIETIHTGGYAALVDARDGDVRRIRFSRCSFRNNRPHKFGLNPAAIAYGAWTGGIHYQNDGRASESKLFAVYGLTVEQCRFERSTGNCLWGHGYGFDCLHRDVSFIGNSFRDTGLDGIELGNTEGGTVKGNTFYRIGYMPATDADDAVWSPAWDSYLGANIAPVALDSTGVVRAVDYTGNTAMNVNGECFDLDGYSDGAVSGNIGTISASDDPYYALDEVATYGPGETGQCTRGMTLANNYDPRGGLNVTITGNTLVNCLGGSLALGAARGCQIGGNTINQPSAAYAEFGPITLFNTGSDVDHRSSGNTVVGNTIVFGEAAMACIAELDTIWGTSRPFTGDDSNRVFGNHISGTNDGEFKRSANSASGAGMTLSTVDAAGTGRSETVMQREGRGSTAALKIYKIYKDGGGVIQGRQVASIADEGAGTASKSPLFNVSEAGGAGTGALTTGNRNVAGIADCTAVGKVFADGFLSLTDSTYSGTEADSLSDAYGLIRYDSTAKKFVKSVNVSGGNRVWTDLVLQEAGGSNTQVQYNSSGVLAGSANLTWNNTSRVLTVTGLTGTAAIAVVTAFISSAEGYYSSSALYNAFHAPNGGFTGKQFTVLGGTAPSGGAGLATVYYDSTANKLKVSENNGAFVNLVNVPGGSSTHIQYNSSGVFAGSANLAWNNADQVLTVTGKTGTAAIAVVTAFVSSVEGFYSVSALYNAFHAPNGGFAGKQFTVFGGTAPSGGAGLATLYYNSSTNKLMVSENNGAFVNLVGAGGTPGGSDTHVQYNSSGAFAGSANLTWNNTNQVLTVTGKTGTAGIAVVSSFVSSAEGFYSASALYNAFHAPNGGFAGKQFTVFGGTAPSGGAGLATLYYNSSTNKLMVSENNGAFVNLVPAAGVTGVHITGYGAITGDVTIAAGTNVSLGQSGSTITVNAATQVSSICAYGYSPLTGAVSIIASTNVTVTQVGQGIYIASAVPANISCTTLSASSSAGNAIQAASGGVSAATLSASSSAGNAIQASSGGVSALTITSTGSSAYNSVQSYNGGISATTGFYIGSNQVIDSNRAFVGLGVNVGTGGVRCGAVNPYVGGVDYNGQTVDVTGTFTIGGVAKTTLSFKGGVICTWW